MKPRLSPSALKHEAFVLALLSGLSAADAARKAGYGRKNINVRILAWELLQREDVQRRLVELSEVATDEAVLSILARRQVLSQIARARLCDYQDKNGRLAPLDGDVPNPAAIESVEYRWDPIRKESYPWRIKLRDPVDAIVELCRLDGSYKKPSASVTVAPITNVVVIEDARTKLAAILNKLSARIAEAKGTVLLGDAEQEETSEKTSR